MPSPVLPAVASTIVPPGCKRPVRSASSSMERPILSFTLPPGLYSSSLAKSCTPSGSPRWFSFTSGVFPIKSCMES